MATITAPSDWSGIRPGFFWVAWTAMMFASVAGLAMGVWQDGRPDIASSSGALVFLMIGGLYRRRLLVRAAK